MYNNKIRLEDYIKICNLHAESLYFSLAEIENYGLTQPQRFETLNHIQKNTMDSFIMRFGQLQDTIGTKIFPSILPIISEKSEHLITVIDRLNELEKREYLPSAEWWKDLRDLRNASSYDYPNDYEAQFKHYKKMKIFVPQLLEYWQELKEKIEILIVKIK